MNFSIKRNNKLKGFLIAMFLLFGCSGNKQNAILFKDVVKRWNVRYPTILTDIASSLLSNFCREINHTEMAKSLNVKSVHTVQNYVDYLEKAYFITRLTHHIKVTPISEWLIA